MGVELFALPWVEAVTTFFSYFGWALFGVGLVVGAFECAIEYQGGRGSIKDTAMNYIKGFMAVSLFKMRDKSNCDIPDYINTVVCSISMMTR